MSLTVFFVHLQYCTYISINSNTWTSAFQSYLVPTFLLVFRDARVDRNMCQNKCVCILNKDGDNNDNTLGRDIALLICIKKKCAMFLCVWRTNEWLCLQQSKTLHYKAGKPPYNLDGWRVGWAFINLIAFAKYARYFCSCESK